jgi:DNA-binding CsgD family transcriptional regulator
LIGSLGNPRAADAFAARLGQGVGSTPVEAEVAREFREDRRIREMAVCRDTSPETLRSQVKAIYAKVGVDSHVAFLAQISRDRSIGRKDTDGRGV